MEMTIDIRPLAPALGAEVIGADLSQPLSDDAFARIKRAHLDHCVLIFRNQHLTPAQHIAFSRRFGDLHIHMLEQYLMEDHPEILVLSNVKQGSRAVGTERKCKTTPSTARAKTRYHQREGRRPAGRGVGSIMNRLNYASQKPRCSGQRMHTDHHRGRFRRAPVPGIHLT